MMMKGNKRFSRWAYTFVVAGVGLFCGLILSANCNWSPSSEAKENQGTGRATRRPSVSRHIRSEDPVPLGDFASPFVAVAERVKPGVVNVDTQKHMDVSGSNNPHGDLLREFFPDLSDEGFEYPSSASGFVFNEDGYIITNNHVIQNAEKITIRFIGGDEYGAEVVGVDPSTDIAVLRIEGEGPFPVVPLGDSDSIRVGDWAIAVGNPFGYLEGSVTVGVVSAKGRNDLEIAGGSPIYQNFIQTDASINFGNSGGPLVNIRGYAIGVNTAVNASGQGIGFTIPINLAARIANELVSRGKVMRAYIGVYPQALTPDIVEGKNLDIESGILVGQVIPNTPADRAGMRRGDVILSFDGIEIRDVNQFRMLVAETEVGRTIALVVNRNGSRIDLEVALAERPDYFTDEAVKEKPDLWLGMEVIDPSEEPGVTRSLGIEGIPGVLVAAVEPGSAAWEAGIRPGDLIREVNDRAIRDMGDYLDAGKKLLDIEKPVIFLVHRDGVTLYIAVRSR